MVFFNEIGALTPFTTQVITRVVQGHHNGQLDDLLPWAYACPSEPWAESGVYETGILIAP